MANLYILGPGPLVAPALPYALTHLSAWRNCLEILSHVPIASP